MKHVADWGTGVAIDETTAPGCLGTVKAMALVQARQGTALLSSRALVWGKETMVPPWAQDAARFMLPVWRQQMPRPGRDSTRGAGGPAGQLLRNADPGVPPPQFPGASAGSVPLCQGVRPTCWGLPSSCPPLSLTSSTADLFMVSERGGGRGVMVFSPFNS